jgi:small subunit ribosomal protein S17e
MGRIKSLMVKKAARQLLATKPESFKESFEHNKKVLGSNNMPSKPIRNKVAGYIARLVKMQKAVKKPKPAPMQEIQADQYQ